MKAYKTRISCMAVFLLLLAGCGEDQQKNVSGSGSNKADNSIEGPFAIETTSDFIVDVSDGNNGFEPFRMLNESNDLEKEGSDAFEEVWSILDDAKWEAAAVSMSRSADYRIEVVDKRDKEKPVTTLYYMWANPEYKSVELVDPDHTRYVLIKKPESEKLYKFLTNKNLSDHVVVE